MKVREVRTPVRTLKRTLREAKGGHSEAWRSPIASRGTLTK